MTPHAMTMEEYRALPAWSSSDLKAMRRGPPAMVPWLRANPLAETDSMRLGTAAHCAVLEADAMTERFAFKPEDMSFATKEGKAWRASQGGKTILTHAEAETVRGVWSAFHRKAIAKAAFEAAVARECPLFWMQDGVECKARPDWFTADAVYDLKVTRHAEERALQWRAYGEGWMHQLAYYRTGLRANGFDVRLGRLVAIHPKPPHPVYCVEVKENVLDLLALENERTLARIDECARTGVWPGTPDSWEQIELPPSALADVAGFLGGDE